MLTIVDYGQGNVGSIQNMLRKGGHEATLGSTAESIDAASGLILPGVGAFDNGMRKLHAAGLIEALDRRVRGDGVPVLGICLGAQLMTRRSDEGDLPGLGWIDADTVQFFRDHPLPLKVPFMGWQDVSIDRPHWLADGLEDPRFYFVHSFHFACDHPADVLMTAEYGYRYPAAFARDNVVGVQFHPEKSHRFGMRLLANFARAAAAVPRGSGG